MRAIMLVLLLLIATQAFGFQYWNDIRHSALLPDDTVTIRTETPSGAGIDNFLLYSDGTVQESPLMSVIDGPATVEATVPGPVAAGRFYGFRKVQGEQIDLMPVRLPDSATPVPEDLTRLATDPEGDDLYGLANLDLVDCFVGTTDTRLFAALTNAGGGFPVNQLLTFYGYLLGVADPAATDPDTVFALLYTFNQPGIISPGLYKITGTGLDDLEQIGEVTVQEFPAANTLLLSCDLADLMADPFFQSWYDPADPKIDVAGFTQRITLLGGAVEADRTPGGDMSLREFQIVAGPNQLPDLSNLEFHNDGGGTYAQVVYSDPDGHCPVQAEIVFGGTDVYPMFPQSLDYGTPVVYRTAPGLNLPFGTVAETRFSDDGLNVVTLTEILTAAPTDPGSDSIFGLRVANTPNPFSSETAFRVELPAAGLARLAVFDLAGRLVAVVADQEFAAGQHTIQWNGLDRHGRVPPAGLYFYRLRTNRGEVARRLLMVH